MDKLIKILFLISFTLFIFGCASGSKLQEKSYTINSLSTEINGAIAIVPIKEVPAMPGLADRVEVSMQKSLNSKLSKVPVVDVDTFKSRIAKKSLEAEFGQWKAAYDSTKILSAGPMKSFSNAVEARYFLLVPSIYLTREPISVHEAGFTGVYIEGQAFWRSDLKVLAELLDTETAKIVWKGVGHAQNIHAPTRYQFFVRWDEKNPELEEYISPMIKAAVDGIAESISAGGTARKK